MRFPSQPRERIAIASYPFREFIAGRDTKTAKPIDLKDFAAHVIERFHVNKIEPWSGHFPSIDPRYLDEFRAAVEKVGGAIVNMAVDGESSPYSADGAERQKAITFSKQWVDIAAALGSPSIRTNIPAAKESKPDLGRTAESLMRVVEYAETRNVIIHLENDNPVSEDPFFLVQVIDKVNNPWLRSNPDFANTLAHRDEEYAYRGLDALFAQAYGICHVKNAEQNDHGKIVHVDMAKAFAILKRHDYKGYCSMEWDAPGDPYKGTAELIETTLRLLA